MTNDAQLRAFEALREHPRLGDLATLTREVATAAAEGRRPDAAGREALVARAEALALPREEADTPFGNALAVLERGPEDAAERALAAGLWAHAIARLAPEERETERLVGDILWLAAHTAFDATGLLDHALGTGSGRLWEAMAELVRRSDAQKAPAPSRGEATVAALALSLAQAPAAVTQVGLLAAELKDPMLLRALTPQAKAPELPPLEGELAFSPRSAAATTVLAFTGLLFLLRGAELLLRGALAFRRPATLTFTDVGFSVATRTVLLGRTLRRGEILLPYEGLTRASREVRFPRVAFYAGLLALVVGSYFGLAFFVDGLRAASPSLLLTGVVVVGLGIALDFALTSLVPGVTRKCRVVLQPRRGAPVCLSGVDVQKAEAAFETLLPRS